MSSGRASGVRLEGPFRPMPAGTAGDPLENGGGPEAPVHGTEDSVAGQERFRPSPVSRMRDLATVHPELAVFTPDATLTEIKLHYGLGSFADVLKLAARRRKRI
jgi:hypothetical protein